MTGAAVAAGSLLIGGLAMARRAAGARRAVQLRIHGGAASRPTRAPRGPKRRIDADEAVASLPEVVDLLAVAVAAGLPVPAALEAVAPWIPEPWRSALARCLHDAADGTLLADVLGRLPADVGDAARPLVGVLQAGLVDGDGLAAGLAHLAGDTRDRRRRRAEERARRIPVRLLLPLVACSLPAFAVLTIVPILAGALRGLRFPT